jgi:sugar phosphate isomerase/epimerase
MQRRNFVRSLLLGAAGMQLAPQLAASPPNKALGVQLWNIREYLKKDLAGSLARLAKLGYTQLELFGYDGTYWGKSPAAFAKLCSDLGFTIISSHYETGRIDKVKGSLWHGWDKAVADAAAMDIPYMVCAWLFKEERTSIGLYKELADKLNTCGEQCRKAGIQLAYHSHNFEFPPIDGIIPYDLLLQQTDPGLLHMESDLFWFTKAGIDPVAYFHKYPGRFPLWHVKDMEKGSEQFAEVGHGIIDFDRIFAARQVAGLKYWFVEQDQASRDPFESLAMSRDYVIKKNY